MFRARRVQAVQAARAVPAGARPEATRLVLPEAMSTAGRQERMVQVVVKVVEALEAVRRQVVPVRQELKGMQPARVLKLRHRGK